MASISTMPRAPSRDRHGDGNGILGHLFGSKDLSRAVASQAAQASGIGQNVLQQMMPAIAAMLMGGLFKQSTNQLQAGSFGASNPLGEIIEQMMRQAGWRRRSAQAAATAAAGGARSVRQSVRQGAEGYVRRRRQRRPRNRSRRLEQAATIHSARYCRHAGRRRGRAFSAAARPSPDVATDNPLGKILQDMLGGGSRAPDAQAAPDPQSSPSPRANPSGRAKEPL